MVRNFRHEYLQDQEAIAQTLGTLDDKIELNQKMNQTLEEIVKAIFKSWFVDFDPVRAKQKVAPQVSPEISDLFPDELVIPRLERSEGGIAKVRLSSSFNGKGFLQERFMVCSGLRVFSKRFS